MDSQETEGACDAGRVNGNSRTPARPRAVVAGLVSIILSALVLAGAEVAFAAPGGGVRIFDDPEIQQEEPVANPRNGPVNSKSEPNLRGAEGIEFQPIALDTSVACSATVMKGSRRFQDTVFVFPRVLVSTNARGERLFEITPLAKDRYLVRFSVYFPRTDQDLRIDDPQVGVSLRRCNLDEVKRAINSGGNANVRTVSRVPISTIDVKVDGLQSPFTLGGGQASMLNYQDSGHVVEFEVSDRAQLESLLARVQSEIGLGIHVAMRFNARTADGGATITVDLRSLAARLGGSLRGKKWIAQADLRVMLEQALKQMRVVVETESGSGYAHAYLSQQLVSMISSVAYTDGGLTPITQECREYGYCDNLRSNHGASDPNQSEEPAEPSDGAPVSVSFLLDYLNKKGSYQFEYNNVGASEMFVYRTSVYFKGEIADPDLRRYRVSSGERRVIAHRLEKDVLVSLAVPEIQRDRLKYMPQTRYFSSGEVREYGLHRHFERLTNERLPVQDVVGPDGLVARQKASDARRETNYYVWGQAEAAEVASETSIEELEPTLAALKEIPLTVSFDALGSRKFHLSELAQDNVYWFGSFDEVGGRILFRPRRSLGQMTVRNVAEERMQDVDVRWLFEEYRNSSRGLLATQRRNEIRKRLPVTKTTVSFMVGTPSEESEAVSVRATDSKSQLDLRGPKLPIKRAR